MVAGGNQLSIFNLQIDRSRISEWHHLPVVTFVSRSDFIMFILVGNAVPINVSVSEDCELFSLFGNIMISVAENDEQCSRNLASWVKTAGGERLESIFSRIEEITRHLVVGWGTSNNHGTYTGREDSFEGDRPIKVLRVLSHDYGDMREPGNLVSANLRNKA